MLIFPETRDLVHEISVEQKWWTTSKQLPHTADTVAWSGFKPPSCASEPGKKIRGQSTVPWLGHNTAAKNKVVALDINQSKYSIIFKTHKPRKRLATTNKDIFFL